MCDYPETADIETSSENYALRFSGKIGKWMLKIQQNIVLKLIGDIERSSILDVGGGHGQLAFPLAEDGFKITVLGSDRSCGERFKKKNDINFITGNLIDLPFPDQTFDIVISIRLLPHCKQWRELIRELCRVTRGMVIVDYPTSSSFNCLSSILFSVKKKIEGNTRPFTLFKHKDVTDEFAVYGFGLVKREPEFFLPMVFHRIIKSPFLSSLVEVIFKKIGFTKFFGSPVLAEFTRITGK